MRLSVAIPPTPRARRGNAERKRTSVLMYPCNRIRRVDRTTRIMSLLSKNCICLSIGIICFVTQVLCRPQQTEIGVKADQIFDVARQTVTDAVGIAQGVLGLALGAAKNGVIGEINIVQNVAKLGVDTGRNIIEFGEQTLLDAIPNLNATLGINKK